MARKPRPAAPRPPAPSPAAPHGSWRRRLTSLLLVAGLAGFLALLLALPLLTVEPPPGTAATGLPKDMPDLSLPPVPAAAAETERRPGFVDVTAQAHLGFRQFFLEREQGYTFLANQYNHGSGLAVGDVDGDGHPDVYFVNQMGENGLLRNLGDGTFEDITAWAGVGVGDRVCAGATFADVDNDGDADLFVTSYRGGNLLFLNRGDGRFIDATARSGLGDAVRHSVSATFFDAENDGDLDLYVVNVGKFTTNQQDPENGYYTGTGLGLYYGLEKGETDQFYRNLGDGRFTDASQEVGLADTSWGGDVAADDLDGDGFLDLYIANMYGEDEILINEGGKRFRNATQQRTPSTPYGAMGSAIADFDGDGDLDIFVADMHSDMWMDLDFPLRYVRPQHRYPTPFGMFDYRLSPDDLTLLRSLPQNQRATYGNALLVNDGTGHFVDRAVEAKVESFWPWGAQAGDFDRDGDLDIFIPSGMGFPWAWWPSALMMNQGDGTFSEEGVVRGLDDLALGHTLREYRLWNRDFARSVRAGALLDYDGDGADDLVTNGYNCHATLWRNVFAREAPGRHWVQLLLRGTRSNREAIGARVTLTAGGRTMVRTVQGAHGYISQSSLVLTIGLDRAERVDALAIRWPSGLVQQVELPRVDIRYVITEGEPEARPWQPTPVSRRLPDQPLPEVGWEPKQRIPADIVPQLGKRFGMGQARR